MVDTDSSPPLLDEIASLRFQRRRPLAATLRRLSETFGGVPDGKNASHVLGVLAHLLDPA
jgi:hypothetical protein